MSESMSARVEVVDRASDQAVEVMRYSSELLAEKAERGVNRNLDHERYYTRIIMEGEDS